VSGGGRPVAADCDEAGGARRPQRLAGALLLVLAWGVALWGMRPALEAGPWRHSWLGHNGARYAQIARNTLRLGPTFLGGAPLLDPEGGGPAGPEVYAHHPPGVSLALAAIFSVAGEGERQASAFAAACTLLGLLLLARLVGGEAGALAGGLAALAAACQPFTWAYGAHVDPQGPPVLAASLAVLLAYRRWLRGGSLWPWLLLSALASACDWWGLYAPAGCALHLALVCRRWRPALGLAAWTAALFVGWLLWLTHLPGFSLAALLSAAEVRGPSQLLEGPSAGALPQALATWFEHSWRLMPAWPLLVLVGAALCRLPSGTHLGRRGLLLLLLLPPLVHGVLFPAGMLVHSYWLFGLPVGLGAVLGLLPGRRGAIVALLGSAALLATGLPARAELLPDAPSELPALLGRALHEHVPAGELVLTNYDGNPLRPGSEGPAFLAKRPELTYYSDRAVRGLAEEPGRADLQRWEEARARCPTARWFLLVPWPRPPEPALVQAVEAAASGRLELQAEPPVVLYSLRP